MRTLRLSAARVACLGGLLASSSSSLSGCVMPSSSTDAGTTTIPLTGDSGALTGTPTGTGCITDPTTNVSLCTGSTECPSVNVDQSVYPQCGYFFNGGLVYLACLCAGDLCPIGQPATCAQAAALLQSSNEGTVCAEVNNSGCTVVTSGAATDATTASDAGSGCDETCYSSCAGEPDCIQLCGC
jgi:hypothetical protein